MSRRQNLSRYQKGRSRVLHQMITFLVVLFILSGTAIFLSFRSSQNGQIQESIDVLVKTYNEDSADGYDFIYRSLAELTQTKFPDVGNQETIDALAEGRQTPAQDFLNEQEKGLADANVLGGQTAFAVLMPSSPGQRAIVVASSDEGLPYNWEVPNYLEEALRNGDPYLYLPNGMPELGLSDETLVLLKMGGSASGFPLRFVTIASTHDKIEAFNAFYNEQRKDASMALGLIMLITLIPLTLLSYLGLAYLIRKRITKPIDELSAAAQEVIAGNLDVEIKIRRGEEFEGLKYAFKELLESFRRYIARSVGEEQKSQRAPAPKHGRKRSRILYQMTAFLVVLFILSGLAIFFSFNAIRNRQFRESVDYMLQDHYENASQSYDYIYKLFGYLAYLTLPEIDYTEEVRAYLEKRPTPVTEYYSAWLKKMVDDGFLGADIMFVIQPPSALTPQPQVYVSSDPSLIFKWRVPDYLMQAIDEGASFLYLPNGIPELGLNDETSVVFKRHDFNTPSIDMKIVYVGAGSVHDKVVAANDFYNHQRRASTISLALIMLLSSIILSLLSFFGLGYLIRKRITEPIDGLAATAEEVIDGNLDVEIDVQEGEELEGLKYAFNELLESFRKLISKSISS